MNLVDVQLRVKKQFGDTSGAVIDDSDIARWATDAQTDIVRKTKCNTQTFMGVSISGTAILAVTNILDVTSVEYAGQVITRITGQDLDQRFPSRDVAGGMPGGGPKYWTWTGGGIKLFPTPDVTGDTVTVVYNRRPVDVVNPTDPFEIPVEYHEDIVVKCLQRAYETDGQWSAAGAKDTEYKARTSETMAETKWKDDGSFPSVRCLPGDEGNA